MNSSLIVRNELNDWAGGSLAGRVLCFLEPCLPTRISRVSFSYGPFVLGPETWSPSSPLADSRSNLVTSGNFWHVGMKAAKRGREVPFSPASHPAPVVSLLWWALHPA